MGHVAISYSRKDTEFVDLLEADLLDSNHTSWLTWRDTSNIPGGADWRDNIEESIKAGYALIVVVTANSLASDEVQAEIKIADDNKKPIIPITLEKCDVGDLGRFQIVDFSKVSGARGLAKIAEYRTALRQLIKAVDAARPLLRYSRDLNDTDPEVRERAAMALGELDDLDAAEALLGVLTDDDSDVRVAAAWALGKLSASVATRPLMRRLKEDDDADVCAQAARALGRIGSAEGILPLMEALRHEDRFVRQNGAWALGHLDGTAAIPGLIHMMRNDPISDVREAAKEALQRIGGPEAERALRRARPVGQSGTNVEPLPASVRPDTVG